MTVSKAIKSKKIKEITEKQKPYFFRDKILFTCARNLFLTVTWVKRIELWVSRHQYYITRIIYSDNINQSKIDKIIDIANRCGKLRQDLWNKYGSLQAWGEKTNTIRDRAKKVFSPDSYGLPFRIWESTARDVIDDIHACQASAINAVIKKIYCAVKDEKKRKELIAKLKTKEFLLDPWLHQLIRNQYKRGHTYVNNQIVLNSGQYSVQRGKDGITWISVMSLVWGKHIPLRFRAGKNIISEKGKIRLIIDRGVIELHFPVLAWKQPNISKETIGVDRGYTEVFYGSNGKAYGNDLGSILTQETEARHHKGRRRNKLNALAKNTDDKKKADRIKKNNLGTIKQKRRLNAAKSRIKSIVGSAVNQVFDDTKTLILEDLTHHIRSKKQIKSLNRKLSNWTKGVVAEMVENSAIRRCSTLVLVNCAYSSQVDSRNGTLLGRRDGDSFFTFDGMIVQADLNAARVIEQRVKDLEISLYMSSDQIHTVLMKRTAEFLKKHEMSLVDAVQSAWLDKKHLIKQESLRKRCI